MDVHLKVLLGTAAGQRIKVVGPKFYIGRAEDCQLRPRSDLISRHHCGFLIEGDYVAIRDLGSRNGTFVNETRVSGECQLKLGDHVRVGALEFEVCFELSPAPPTKRPPVKSVKEAAARAADSKIIQAGENLDETDLSDWLSAEAASDTGKANEAAENTVDELIVSDLDTSQATGDQAAGPKTKEERPKSGSGSDEAAAAMLRKLRRFR